VTAGPSRSARGTAIDEIEENILRSWTTRALHVALLAVGAAGIGATASAAELPGIAPDLANAPESLGGDLPVPLCHTAATEHSSTPCADSGVSLRAPNTIKHSAQQFINASHEVAGQLPGKHRLDAHQIARLLSMAERYSDAVGQVQHERPDLGLGVRPAHTGLVDNGTFFNGMIGPRKPDQPGVSVADSQFQFDVMHGQQMRPLAGAHKALPAALPNALPNVLPNTLPAGPRKSGVPSGLPLGDLAPGTLPIASDTHTDPGQLPLPAAQQLIGGGNNDGSAQKPEFTIAHGTENDLQGTPMPVNEIIGKVEKLAAGAQPGAGGRHRAKDDTGTSPLGNLPALGELTKLVNNPLSGGVSGGNSGAGHMPAMDTTSFTDQFSQFTNGFGSSQG
jgi:hypothetical protein